MGKILNAARGKDQGSDDGGNDVSFEINSEYPSSGNLFVGQRKINGAAVEHDGDFFASGSLFLLLGY